MAPVAITTALDMEQRVDRGRFHASILARMQLPALHNYAYILKISGSDLRFSSRNAQGRPVDRVVEELHVWPSGTPFCTSSRRALSGVPIELL